MFYLGCGGGSLQLKDLDKTLQFLTKNPFFVEMISIQYVRPQVPWLSGFVFKDCKKKEILTFTLK